MTLKPLDPCPVCGASVYTVGAGGRSVECAGLIGHSYSARLAEHRRLCAEVALARVVMVIDADPNVQFALAGGLKGSEYLARFADAIARVREASK